MLFRSRQNSVENQGFFQITTQHLIHLELRFLMMSNVHLTKCALKQEITVVTSMTLVCRYMVRYHGEWFDFACVQVVHT